jgi:hypothetical protein
MSTSSRYTTAKNRHDRTHDRVTPRGPKRPRTEAEESDEAAGRNRHRVTRACNECRRRKDRCGGQRPSCTSCLESSRTCSYGPSKKRGLRPGYVRGIEVLLGLVFTTVEGSESYVHGLLQGQIQHTSVRPQVSRVEESDISAEFLLEAWRKCSVANEVKKLLSPEGVEDEDDGTDSTQYFDTKVSEALALSISARAGDTGAPLTPMNTDTTPHDVILTSPDVACSASYFVEASPQTAISHPPEPTTSFTLGCPSSSVTELPKNWPFLLDLYFETTHSWFPISQKHELLRAAYTLANRTSTSAADLPTSAEIAFLQAVLLYASHQSSFILNSPTSTQDNAYNIMSGQDLTQSSLFANPSSYDLGHVRAFLVLALFNMDQKLWSTAWVNIGRAVYTAISTGLIDRNSATANLPCDDNVKRTLLGCATLETIISARLNTVSYFKSSDILSRGLLTIDGMEEWELWQPKILLQTGTTLNQQVPSSHVPGHVISTFNKLLQVIASLNDLNHQERNPPPEGMLVEIMRRCQQNLGNFGDVRTAVDLPPQTLCLWMVSIATLETAAATLLVSNGTGSERPESYWTSVTLLVSLMEKRTQSIGRCSIPPVFEACFILLQQTLVRQQLSYVGTDYENDFNHLEQTLSRYLAASHSPLDKETQMDITYDPRLNSIDSEGSLFHSYQLLPANSYIAPRTNIGPRIPLTNQTQDALLRTLESTMSQDEAQICISESPGLTKGIAFEPLSASLGDEMDDDGLFDSLATLDSTDW